MSVWDPEVELQFKHTGSQAAGEEWISTPYTLSPDEILEIYRIEIIPPVDATTGLIRKLRYVTLYIEGSEYESLRINSVMAPLEHPNNVGVAVDLGVPILHYPITGRMPTAIEATCPKVARGQKLSVKTVADEAITEDYTIVLKAARVMKTEMLSRVVPFSMFDASFTLDRDTYSKPPIPITLERFDELPGGLRQSKPQIFPWFTYARNKQATTPNTPYEFDYDAYAAYPWMELTWNLVNKETAYIVNALGVIPHANSKSLRLFVSGRATTPEFITRPLPEKNFFYPPMYYDTSVNANIKRAGPRKLAKPFLFHGVKGAIQILDNGTSIPANGVEVMVYGIKFVLR
jgi:hypothetical protein